MPPTLTPFRIEVVGFLAAALTTFSLVPQLARIWRRRSADDISVVMFSLFSLGVLLWLIYGTLLHSWPMMLANSVTLALSLAILALRFCFARKTNAEVRD